MASAAQAVALFDSWVDQPNYIENPARSNCTQVTRDYGAIGGATCYAWCCAACWSVLTKTGTPFPKTAQVLDATNRARRGELGMAWVSKAGTIRVGDLSCFDWKGNGNAADMHISMVRNPSTQAKFQTVGGNENDRVSQTWRDREHVMGFIRPPYDDAPPTQGDDDMFSDTDRQLLKDVQAAMSDMKDAGGQFPSLNALAADVAAIKTKVDKLTTGGIDYPALAKAVNDDLAARLKS